jgi:hypothetical protein
LAWACSSEPEEAERTRADFCDEWAEAACSSETVAACQAASRDDCRIAQEAYCLELVPDDFADDLADACLDAVSRAYADADLSGNELKTVLRLGAPCDGIIRGESGEGEACTTSRDCDGPAGYTCVRKGGSLAGTCRIPETVGAGRSCAEAQQVCEDGFFCNGRNCVEYLPVGSSCANHEECGDLGYCAAGTCTARLAVNAPCLEDTECRSGVCFTFGNGDRVCTDTLRLSRSEPHCDTLR